MSNCGAAAHALMKLETMLEFIFFFIVGIYLFGLLGRLLLKYWIRKQQQAFENGTGPFTRTYTWGTQGRRRPAPKPEGDVTIQQSRASEKKVSKNVGDYVDYEEIKTE